MIFSYFLDGKIKVPKNYIFTGTWILFCLVLRWPLSPYWPTPRSEVHI